MIQRRQWVVALSRLATLLAGPGAGGAKVGVRRMRGPWAPATAVLATFALMVSACASMSASQRRQIFQDVPPRIDTNARYFFHMHGSIVEEQGPNARGRHGQYRYDWILEALADRGFVVVGEVRSRTQVLTYANTVAGQVAKLRGAGVPADHITVTGMSKGGAIAVLASAVIGNPDVRFVVMAGCGRLDGFNVAGGLRALARRPQGRVLSIYDRHDTEAGPCARHFTGAPGLVFEEIVLDVGLGHALFYTPEPVWVDRVVDFALGRKALGTADVDAQGVGQGVSPKRYRTICGTAGHPSATGRQNPPWLDIPGRKRMRRLNVALSYQP